MYLQNVSCLVLQAALMCTCGSAANPKVYRLHSTLYIEKLGWGGGGGGDITLDCTASPLVSYLSMHLSFREHLAHQSSAVLAKVQVSPFE